MTDKYIRCIYCLELKRVDHFIKCMPDCNLEYGVDNVCIDCDDTSSYDTSIDELDKGSDECSLNSIMILGGVFKYKLGNAHRLVLGYVLSKANAANEDTIELESSDIADALGMKLSSIIKSIKAIRTCGAIQLVDKNVSRYSNIFKYPRILEIDKLAKIYLSNDIAKRIDLKASDKLVYARLYSMGAKANKRGYCLKNRVISKFLNVSNKVVCSSLSKLIEMRLAKSHLINNKRFLSIV